MSSLWCARAMAAALTVHVLAFSIGSAAAEPPRFREPVSGASGTPGHDVSFWMVGVMPGTDPASTDLTVSADMRPFGGPMRARFVDQGLVCDDDTRDGTYFACFSVPLNAPAGTRTITLTVEDAQGRSSTVQVPFTVQPAVDTDGDGLPDRWETAYGFDPAAASEAGSDADGDGVTDLQEFRDGTHPRGTLRRYFAEGATSAFFDTRLAIYNPGPTEASVLLRMLASDGAVSTLRQSLPTRSVQHLDLRSFSPGNDFSLVVESDQLVVTERTMVWDRRVLGQSSELSGRPGYGSHAETGIEGPGTDWYLAEGATHGGFDLFYLLQNPGRDPATVTVRYLRPAPLPVLTRTYTVGPQSRRTIWVDAEGPELAATDVSASIASDRPIVVERAMYFSTPGQPFAAGHAGAGVPALSTDWYLAEGASGYFDGYVLLANPQPTDATVTISYLTEAFDPPISKTYVVAANSRRTLSLNEETRTFSFGGTGSVITSSVPIVVERAMWWPSGQWHEAHLVAAGRTAARRWAIAAGDTRSAGYGSTLADESETYVLIANPSATDTTVSIRVDGYGIFSGPMTIPLRAGSRLTLPGRFILATVSGHPGWSVFSAYGLVIESAGPGIVVERATYTDHAGVQWASGTAAFATPLPE